jgi:hypothetical protein
MRTFGSTTLPAASPDYWFTCTGTIAAPASATIWVAHPITSGKWSPYEILAPIGPEARDIEFGMQFTGPRLCLRQHLDDVRRFPESSAFPQFHR